MGCELHDQVAWPALLQARTLLAQRAGDLLFLERDGVWHCTDARTADLRGATQAVLAPDPRASEGAAAHATGDRPFARYEPRADGTPGFVHPTGRSVDAGFLSAVRVYLPVLLGTALARHRGRVFVAAHLTQTLDGRIACANGQSQWIGNDSDLRHSHRMRALSDGVLVGAGTVLADDPRLTVRHVDGPDPRRIVLSGCGRVLRHDRPLHVFAPPGCHLVLGADPNTPAPPATATPITLPKDRDGRIAPAAIREALAARGIHSVYLEGGSMTVSTFLHAGAIDLLQVHVAAMVLGSGLPSLSLPPVEHVRDGLRLAMDHAILGGHVLLSCWPQNGPAA